MGLRVLPRRLTLFRNPDCDVEMRPCRPRPGNHARVYGREEVDADGRRAFQAGNLWERTGAESRGIRRRGGRVFFTGRPPSCLMAGIGCRMPIFGRRPVG